MLVLYQRCAAVDIGKDVIAVAVRLPGDIDHRQTIKRTFKTFYGVLKTCRPVADRAAGHPRGDGSDRDLLDAGVSRAHRARRVRAGPGLQRRPRAQRAGPQNRFI